MSNYVIVGGELYHCEELRHYGIKGMKWGVRRFENKNGTLTPAGKKRYSDEVYEKKAAYKQAKKDYNKSFNSAYNKSHQAYSLSKKKRQDNDKRWEDASKKAESMNKAKDEYKKAKKDYDSSPEGMAAAAARRKKALKIGAAVAGTAIAAYGAYKVHEYVKTKNCQIAAERGKKFATDDFFKEQARLQMDFLTDKNVTNNSLSVNVNAYARSSANQASKDSFRTAAKNVMNYKKSGGNLSTLRKLDSYDVDDWFKYSSSRRR